MYVSKEFQPWALRFPNEYYEELYRLRGWKESKGKNKTSMWVSLQIKLYIMLYQKVY